MKNFRYVQKTSAECNEDSSLAILHLSRVELHYKLQEKLHRVTWPLHAWARHVENISKKIASAIGALKRIRQFIDTITALKIYGALIQPHFDYCSSVSDGLNITLNDKLQNLQNRAARVITKSQYDASSSDIFSKLGWDNLLTRRKKHNSILLFKTINDLTQFYLHELFESRSTGYKLRNSEHTLFVPKPRTNYGKRSFSYSGAVLWDELPKNVRTTCSLSQFKRAIDNLFSL